ncbi:SigE family RNA polymerase sigma factor, partial [Streptomyces cinereoruber]|uniref:SigE family RNA polymerase sigma factor n=1 Tax=Streptomyces cinereoruber TaxID=67260 RepID=UPI00363C29C9
GWSPTAARSAEDHQPDPPGQHAPPQSRTQSLVQTTLAKVYARWRRIPRDDIDTYVRRALVNNNISRIRKKRVSHLLTPFLPESEHRADKGHADMVERRATLAQALATLPARQRTVLALRYVDDLSDPDIATVLGCSLGTVKTHARRGLMALRNHPALADPACRVGDEDQTADSQRSPPFCEAGDRTHWCGQDEHHTCQREA